MVCSFDDISQFAALTPLEPRLVKKLQPPITDLISTTPAISLLYECVRTCIIGGMLHGYNGDSLARLCVTKLAAFLQDQDQNCDRAVSSCCSSTEICFSEVYRATGIGQNRAITSTPGSRVSGDDTLEH